MAHAGLGAEGDVALLRRDGHRVLRLHDPRADLHPRQIVRLERRPLLRPGSTVYNVYVVWVSCATSCASEVA